MCLRCSKRCCTLAVAGLKEVGQDKTDWQIVLWRSMALFSSRQGFTSVWNADKYPLPLLTPTGVVDISWPDLRCGQPALWCTKPCILCCGLVISHIPAADMSRTEVLSDLKDYTLVFDRNCLKAPKRIWKLLAWKWKCRLKVWKKETIDDRKRTSRWQTANAHKDRTDDTLWQSNLYTFTVDNAKYLVFLFHTLLSLLWNTAALFCNWCIFPPLPFLQRTHGL